MEIFKISSYCDTYVLKKGNDAIIIDCGAKVNELKKYTQGLNIKAIFITHGHYDHILNVANYVEEFDADVYCSDKAYSKFYDSTRNLSKLLFIPIKIAQNIDFIPLTETVFYIGDFEIQAIYTPGHSDCSYSFLIEDSLFVGDVIFEQGVGRTDFEDGDTYALLDSINKLKNFKQIKNIHSGHTFERYVESENK